jgi:hypothetical protein
MSITPFSSFPNQKMLKRVEVLAERSLDDITLKDFAKAFHCCPRY